MSARRPWPNTTGGTARLQASVRMSYALSCGCTRGRGDPVTAVDANTLPGGVVVCSRHGEYAVVTRVSVYLADLGAPNLEALLRDGGVDDQLTAAQVAAEQAR